MYQAYSADEWRLFIDSSSKSLKAVVLHSGTKYPSLPLAHSEHLKEIYSSVKLLLETLNYKYGWKVIGDFKMVAFLMGLQGFTKNSCFVCFWDSRDRTAHCQRKHCPLKTDTTVGAHNIKHEPLVNPQKVLFPPLYIKLAHETVCYTS